MAVRKILKYGHPFLKKKAKRVECPVTELRELLSDMFETMYAREGVGLAAVQVGEGHSLFVMNASWDKEEKKSGEEEVFINPDIVKVYGATCEREEGCLSVPHIREKVKRKDTLDIVYMDAKGKIREEKGVTGMRARVIQHETDHLHGMLFIERISPTRKLFIRGDLKRLQEEEDED